MKVESFNTKVLAAARPPPVLPAKLFSTITPVIVAVVPAYRPPPKQEALVQRLPAKRPPVMFARPLTDKPPPLLLVAALLMKSVSSIVSWPVVANPPPDVPWLP